MEPVPSTEEGNTPRLLQLALELGFSISIPIAGLAILGHLADGYFKTTPVLLLAGVFLSMPLSVIIIYRKVRDVIR